MDATILGPPVDSVECCLWCKSTDETTTFSAKLLLCCSSCEVIFCHVGCDAVRRRRKMLTEEEVRVLPVISGLPSLFPFLPPPATPLVTPASNR